MPNATVRANARPMPEADATQRANPDGYWRDAHSNLEEQIRNLRCMSSIPKISLVGLQLSTTISLSLR